MTCYAFDLRFSFVHLYLQLIKSDSYLKRKYISKLKSVRYLGVYAENGGMPTKSVLSDRVSSEITVTVIALNILYRTKRVSRCSSSLRCCLIENSLL